MKNKTTFDKTYNTTVNWHLIDADGKILGKVATDAAKILIGKNKAEFSTHQNAGDKVVVTNAKKIAVTGNKLDGKVYIRHTNHPGGIKEETLRNLLERRPEEVIRKAIKGMLPKNKLMQERLNNLYIYAEADHPHQGQTTVTENKSEEVKENN